MTLLAAGLEKVNLIVSFAPRKLWVSNLDLCTIIVGPQRSPRCSTQDTGDKCHPRRNSVWFRNVRRQNIIDRNPGQTGLRESPITLTLPSLLDGVNTALNSCSPASVALPITAGEAGRCGRDGITARQTDKEAAAAGAQIVSVKVFRCWI